jgi:short-subunit dehydrogenase
MKMHLKPLSEQAIVLTGATSGIGLVTAREAARVGARLVLAARNEEALQQLTEELQGAGTEVVHVVADVGNEDDVRHIARTAIERFGGFDTWINNAAVSIYGKVEEVPIEDQKRLFDTNYWGVVYGSRIACEHLRERGGKLINIGSALSERAIPIQGTYSASKAAVMGFTDALRMELEQDNAPVSVTLIKPGAIDTPYKEHAANYIGVEGKNPPPVYAPETVARSILYAAEHHTRDIVVGGGGKVITTLGNAAPWIADKVMGKLMPHLQRTDSPTGPSKGALYEPGEDMNERGGYAWTLESSVYTAMARHKLLTAATALGAATAVYLLASERPQRSRQQARGLIGRVQPVRQRAEDWVERGMRGSERSYDRARDWADRALAGSQQTLSHAAREAERAPGRLRKWAERSLPGAKSRQRGWMDRLH